MSLTERDLKVIWHPYTQMKTAAPPVPIVRGEGSLLFDEDGTQCGFEAIRARTPHVAKPCRTRQTRISNHGR